MNIHDKPMLVWIPTQRRENKPISKKILKVLPLLILKVFYYKFHKLHTNPTKEHFPPFPLMPLDCTIAFISRHHVKSIPPPSSLISFPFPSSTSISILNLLTAFVFLLSMISSGSFQVRNGWRYTILISVRARPKNS